MSKNIVLMYISEISGHHSATIAIEKSVRNIAPLTGILNINAFNYTNPISEKVINRLYMGVIKATPHIWDFLYDNPAIVKKVEKIKQAIHKFNSPKFKTLFDKYKPDAVCCTQAFPCGMVADYKKNYGVDIPLVAVLTDYVPHAYWVYDDINYYVVPSQEVGQRLIQKGVSPEKIKPFGIPFDPEFNQPFSKPRLRRKLGLAEQTFTILIMGGGQGLGPIKKIINSLDKTVNDLQEIVVCGSNKNLYNSLKKKVKKLKKKVLLYGYADNVSELMSAADIIVTKPGGITTAEALAKQLPMVIVKPIPGQEANNTEYLIAKEAAIKVEDPEEIAQVVSELLAQPEKLLSMAKSSARIAKPNASQDIAELLLNPSYV